MSGSNRFRFDWRLSRRFWLWALVWLFALAAPAALAQNTPNPSHPETPIDRLEKITLQLGWKHQFQFAGYYAAHEKGFYSDAGLDVRFSEGGPEKSCISIMMSGQAQYCADDGGNIFRFLKGTPLVALASIFQNSPTALLTRKDSGLETPKDLIGKRVESMHGGTPITEILAMFKREGISLDMLENREDSFGIGKLIDGDVDAMFVYVSNEPKMMEKVGISYNLIRPRSYGIDFYGDALFTSKQEVEDHPDRVRAFRDASLKGWQYAMAHQEEIADLILEKYDRQTSKDQLLFQAKTFEELMQSDLVEIGHMNPDRWHHMADLMINLGLAKSKISLKEFIYDPDFRPDYTRIALILAAVIMLSGLGIAILGRYNVRLSKEISERKKAEDKIKDINEELEQRVKERTRALQKSDDRLTGAIDSLNEGFSLYDADDRLIIFNKKYRALRPSSQDVLERGGTFEDVLRANVAHGNIVEAQGREEEFIQGRMEQHRNPGKPIIRHLTDGSWLMITEAQTPDGGTAVIFSDITAIKEAERKSHEHRAELIDARRLSILGEMSAAIAHELNQPLSVISSYAQGISAKLNLSDALQKDMKGPLEEINLQAERASKIIAGIRAMAGKRELKKTPNDVNAIIQGALELIGPASKKRGVKIETELANDLPALEADQVQIEQLMLNLVRNAFDALSHVSSGSRQITIRTTSSGPEAIQITVEDNGPGIPNEDFQEIFNPFFTTNEDGMGLGLPICRSIVEAHGGRIALEKGPEAGILVRISFPVATEGGLENA